MSSLCSYYYKIKTFIRKIFGIARGFGVTHSLTPDLRCDGSIPVRLPDYSISNIQMLLPVLHNHLMHIFSSQLKQLINHLHKFDR